MDDRFDLGRHEGRLDAIDKHLVEQDKRHALLDEKIDKVLAYVERSKGSWKTLSVIAGGAVGLVEMLHQAGEWIHRHQ